MPAQRKPHTKQRHRHAHPRRGHQLGYLAILLGQAKQSRQPIRLLLEEGSQSSLRFTPQVSRDNPIMTAGLLHVSTAVSDLALSSHTAFSDRRKAKPATLLVCNPVSREMSGWPQVKRTGYFKSCLAILASVAQGKPGLHHGWLAQMLAQRGFVTTQSWRDVSERCCGRPVAVPPGLHKAGKLLIWQPALESYIKRLDEERTRHQQRNPFIDELQRTHVMHWLGISFPNYAAEVLRQYAAAHGTRRRLFPGGAAVPLGAVLAPPKAPEADRRTASAVLAQFEEGAGCTLSQLERSSGGKQHILAKLLEAGQLVKSPDGYVFTRHQLRSYLQVLKLNNLHKETPSVRQLKDTLGLKRRPAEALRALLTELLPSQAEAVSAGRRKL